MIAYFQNLNLKLENYRLKIFLSIAGLMILLAIIMHFIYKPQDEFNTLSLPVTITNTVSMDITKELAFDGKIKNYDDEVIYPKVIGQVLEINVVEGQYVRKGDLLFQIDSRPFIEDLKQNEKEILKTKEEIRQLENKLNQYKDLQQKDIMSEQNIEALKNDLDSLVIELASYEVKAKKLKQDIENSNILSPSEGRVQMFNVKLGGEVGNNNEEPLIKIHTISPIYAIFDVSSNAFKMIKESKEEGSLKISLSNKDEYIIPNGYLSHIDNIDENAHNISLKALFANSDELLKDGENVKIFLSLHTKKDALVIPVSSIISEYGKSYVFTVENSIAHKREIVVDFINKDRAVIKEGLQPGENVVLSGNKRLFEGAHVKILDK